ncbi:MAG: hypothetical protein AAF957_24070 [Planctomycetota bacterium]
MTRTTSTSAITLTALLVAACGSRHEEEQPPGQESPPEEERPEEQPAGGGPVIPDFVASGAPPVVGQGWEVVGAVEPTADERIVRLDVIEPGSKVVELPEGETRPYTEADEAADVDFVYDATRVVRARMGSWSSTKLEELATVLAVRYTAERLEERVELHVAPGVINAEVAAVLEMFAEAGFKDIQTRKVEAESDDER